MRGLRAGRLARPSTATPHPASTRQQAAKSSHPSPARGERKEYEMTTLNARPAAVALTPNAQARITKLMAESPEGAIGVRLSPPRRGCSGLASSVYYVTEGPKFEEQIEAPAPV